MAGSSLDRRPVALHILNRDFIHFHDILLVRSFLQCLRWNLNIPHTCELLGLDHLRLLILLLFCEESKHLGWPVFLHGKGV